METLFTLLFAAALGAAVVWYRDRPMRKQFQNMLEALDAGKVEGKDWKILRDGAGNPTGFRVTMGASAPSDKPERL
jgi:hypothetical protein